MVDRELPDQDPCRASQQPAGDRPPRDPDVDLDVPTQRWELAGHRLDVLGTIAIGGVLGAEARYGLGVALPHPPDGWPTATLAINASGCLLIGVLMVIITEVVDVHRLVRPFFGVGVLGGFTTFSTYSTDVVGLLDTGHPVRAVAYVVVTPLAALVAVWAGSASARALTVVARRRCRQEAR